MAAPEIRLQAKLAATTTITAIVGTAIRPLILWPEELPGIAYVRTDTSFDNDSTGATVHRVVNIDVHCMSTTYALAKSLAELVSGAVAGWTDDDGRAWFQTGESDDMESIPSGQEQLDVYKVVQTFSVTY